MVSFKNVKKDRIWFELDIDGKYVTQKNIFSFVWQINNEKIIDAGW